SRTGSRRHAGLDLTGLGCRKWRAVRVLRHRSQRADRVFLQGPPTTLASVRVFVGRDRRLYRRDLSVGAAAANRWLADAAPRPGSTIQLHRPLLFDLARLQPGAFLRAPALGTVRNRLHTDTPDRRGDAVMG